ncbi:redoxin domain-containing protein [Bathymodiolus thermophilus thioautotrophic gill symbiont]|uniref:Thioredoxin n=2 Tax=Bathymodiolus thermophilus thioautotrophic gill symbiont TaxID=2360 RepID=A0A1J5TXF7_9GAMM|nr:redoxin domain-containing protein [Bathymodiolus thermophilus thioautotrophic gill symbiont]OIR24900.1 thioredoxin [Bathymodiolus thermophilus thioautotrophic gill symbiont]CAB5496328.1 thioredoxin [Bathymodiolus thermophilus thioautotrophic gill symbiont]
MNIKRPSRKTLMQFIMVILAVFVVRAWQQQNLTTGVAPSFTSKTLSGDTINSKPLPNQALLIHFWATWCGICALENDNIQALSKDYKVLNIAMQSGTNAELIKYANEHNMRLDNIINDNSGSLAKLFGVRATPSSFFINPKGHIQFVEVGYVTTLGYKIRLWWAGL